MRILLADDQPDVRSALRLLIEQETGLLVVGEAADAASLLARVAVDSPDIILLDWELPGESSADDGKLTGEELLAQLIATCPTLKIIALSGRIEACQVALSAGADAFVSKAEPPERLLAALRLVAAQAEVTAL
jgi:DNA-binding NarL/FixJ family response regulator